MAELIGFLAMPHGPQLVVTTGQWNVLHNDHNRSGEVVDYVPAYRTPTGVGCGMGFAYWNGSK
jgi:hypothetical protein